MTAATAPAASSGRAAGQPDEAERRDSVRSGVAGLIGAATSGLFGFLLAVVITRGYGPAGSGVFFAAIGVITVATAVCTLGAETGLLWALPRRHSAAGRGDAARVLPVALLPPFLVAAMVALAGLLAADSLAPRVFGPAAGPELLAVSFAAVPVVVLLTLLLAALRCVRPIRAYVSVQFFLLPVARPALVGVAVLVGGGLVAGVSAWLVPAALALLVCLALVAGPLRIGRGAGLRPGRRDWSTFWRFALPRAVSAAIDAGNLWIGVLLTSALAGAEEAGVFGAVGRYVLAGQLAVQGLRVTVSPRLSRLLGAGRTALAAAVHRQLTTWGLVLSWPVYLLLAVFGVGFLELFGPGFTAGTTAMTVLALAMLAQTGVGNVQSLLLMGGRSGLHLTATLGGLLVTVSLGLVLIPGHGATGAAMAWAAGILTENLTAVTCAWLVVRHPLVDGAMVRAAVITVAVVGGAAAVGVLVGGRGMPGLLAAVAVLAVGAAGALPRIRPGIQASLRQIRGRESATAGLPDQKDR